LAKRRKERERVFFSASPSIRRGLLAVELRHAARTCAKGSSPRRPTDDGGENEIEARARGRGGRTLCERERRSRDERGRRGRGGEEVVSSKSDEDDDEAEEDDTEAKEIVARGLLPGKSRPEQEPKKA